MPRRKLKDSIAVLREVGYELPPGFEKFVEDEELRKKGVVEVWQCPDYNRAPAKHSKVELYIRGSVGCQCGKACRRVWSE